MPYTFSVPAASDDRVAKLMTLHKLKSTPETLEFEEFPEQLYDATQCHISAKHRALTKGGRRVHGWALWRRSKHGQFGIFEYVGEYHSVWETPEGKLVDVTPPRVRNHVLFVRDDNATIQRLGSDYTLRTDLTENAAMPYEFRGDPDTSDRWKLPGNHVTSNEYASKLGFELSALVTDAEHG